jgi:hypothetical protein
MLNKQLAKNVLEKTKATARERSFPQYNGESFKWFNNRKAVSANKKVIYFTWII